MKKKADTPIKDIKNMLSDFGYDWHTSDYYISADDYLFSDNKRAPIRPDFYGFFLCIEGWINIKIDSELLDIQPYDILAISPDSVFQRVSQSNNCKARTIFFTRNFLLKNLINIHQLESFQFFTTNSARLIKLDTASAQPMIELYDLLKKKRARSDSSFLIEVIRNLFFAYLYEAAIVYQKQKVDLTNTFTREYDLYLKFKTYLSKNYKEHHDLKFYADLLCISIKYFIQAVKKASGRTPATLIDEAIIAEAKLKLKDLSLSIANIAEDLKFGDQTSFARFFKKRTGLTPSSFRKNN